MRLKSSKTYVFFFGGVGRVIKRSPWITGIEVKKARIRISLSIIHEKNIPVISALSEIEPFLGGINCYDRDIELKNTQP